MAHISKYHDYSLVQLTILNIARMIGSDTEETIVVYSFFPRYASALRNDFCKKTCT